MHNDPRVAFAAPYPGSIVPLNMQNYWYSVVAVTSFFSNVRSNRSTRSKYWRRTPRGKFMKFETTGLWSIMWEFLCLTVAPSCICVERSDLSATLLIAAVIPSRIGLWVYSISVTQLFQKTMPPDIRVKVGGLQTSLNSLFEFITFILGMVYSDVSDFSKLAIIGYSCVGAATTFYTVGIYLPFKN
jgi:hypothetical protein